MMKLQDLSDHTRCSAHFLQELREDHGEQALNESAFQMHSKPVENAIVGRSCLTEGTDMTVV
jgi:hypothetical protein